MENVVVKVKGKEYNLKGPDALTITIEENWVSFACMDVHYYIPREVVEVVRLVGFPKLTKVNPTPTTETPSTETVEDIVKTEEVVGDIFEDPLGNTLVNLPPEVQKISLGIALGLTPPTESKTGTLDRLLGKSLKGKKPPKVKTPKEEKTDAGGEDSVF